jgi:nitrate/nitrite transporter NarK
LTSPRPPSRWRILVLGVLAQVASCVYLYGLPMLVPQLRAADHLSLTAAGWVVVAPSIGLVLTLVAWGAAADRYGERLVMLVGLSGAVVFLALALAASGAVGRALLLAGAGAAGASVNAASGRVVLGWFPPGERGVAMGVRQTAQPLGVALAAITLPPVADRWGLTAALVVPVVVTAVAAVGVALGIVDPPRHTAVAGVAGDSGRSPYRAPTLWRLHAASTLLVVPQFAISVFALEFLVTQRGWSATGAGRLLFVVQLVGALGRVVVGRWSDAVGSRLGPMRLVAVAAAACMVALGAGAAAGSVAAVVALAVGAVVTVADNGLGFTATAELAGTAWSGRALGAQNTAQNVAGSLAPPMLAALIGAAGYDTAFGLCAVLPLLAVAATPVAAETAHRRRPAPGPASSSVL